MSLLSIVDVSVYFGSRALFENLSLSLAAGEKVGLVGRNGVGKSTLLKLISGHIEPETGMVNIARSAKIGILAQDIDYMSKGTVYEEMLSVFEDLLVLRARLTELEVQMGDEELHRDQKKYERVLEEYSRGSESFERSGGYLIDSKIKSVLYGLGFNESCLNRAVAEFSGGERIRLNLGKLLLLEPSLLLLDEPTNHLDLKATEWLEDYLKEFNGALMVVSHDRYFLDVVATKIVELENKTAALYNGNYTEYTAQKLERDEVQLRARERQLQEVAKLQGFVDKWKAGTKATLAKSREKMLAKIELIDEPKGPGKKAHFHFEAGRKSVKSVLTLKGVTKRFNDRQLFEKLDLEVERGDRLGIIGANGSGKSTLLKMVMGLAEPSEGRIELGNDVEIGYFSQDLGGLNTDNTILEEVEEACELKREQVRTLLGSLLFTGEDVFKKISVLSGGERNRVVLAKLLVSKANVLILDEPTNHLDISAKDALETALCEYNGTIILVSHDRYFLNHVVDRIVEIENGRVIQFKGSYSEYRKWKADQASASGASKVSSVKQLPQSDIKRRPRDNSEREKKRIQQMLVLLETEISNAEAEVEALGRRLSDPNLYADADECKAVIDEHRKCQERLDDLYAQWEEVSQASEGC